jgi:hypothetical protein
MKKRFLLMIAALVAIAIGVVGMSAYEAHVVNVTATIENATNISTAAVSYGTVFPQEVLHNPVTLSLSQSFLASDALSVSYKIKQKPKCQSKADPGVFAQVMEDPQDPNKFVCPDDSYVMMDLLCPFLSKHSEITGIDPDTGAIIYEDSSRPSFHGPLAYDDWTNSISEELKVTGSLSENDTSDIWDIDLHVPCIKGQCGQDWADYVKKANPTAIPANYLLPENSQGDLLGCDLWYEVTGVSRNILTSATITSDGVDIGDLSGATINVNGGTDHHELGITDVAVTNEPLADGKYAFYLQADAAQQTALTNYFNAKAGWTGPMLAQIALEINGTDPFFYLKASGGIYTLVDRFKEAMGMSELPLTIDDDYPSGTYNYTGMINAQTITVPLTVVSL